MSLSQVINTRIVCLPQGSVTSTPNLVELSTPYSRHQSQQQHHHLPKQTLITKFFHRWLLSIEALHTDMLQLWMDLELTEMSVVNIASFFEGIDTLLLNACTSTTSTMCPSPTTTTTSTTATTASIRPPINDSASVAYLASTNRMSIVQGLRTFRPQFFSNTIKWCHSTNGDLASIID